MEPPVRRSGPTRPHKPRNKPEPKHYPGRPRNQTEPGNPRTPKNERETSRPKPTRGGDACCEMTINLTSEGGVNIYNCPPVMDGGGSGPGTEAGDGCPPCPRAEGACIPVSPGSKHKNGLRNKLRPLIENSSAPSVLAATILQQSRRFLRGESPGNELEASVFSVLGNLPPELQDTLACAVETLDGLGTAERDSVFSSAILGVDEPLSTTLIADHLAAELEKAAADAVFGTGGCTTEAPGLPRPVFSVVNGGAFLGFIPRTCRVNGLRTIHFIPHLGPGDYEPEEFEQVCTPRVENGQVEIDCEVQTEDCPGHRLIGEGGGCLRVPDVRNGETVLLEGVNFFNIEATVRLQAKAPGTASAEVDAFVCGDQETPATEEADGEEAPINDCRVRDQLTFQIPEELPPGIYEVRVAVPNDTGVEDTPPIFISDEIFVRVVPPATSVFQVASEELRAEKETSPARFGSDEVGLRILSVPILANNTLGSMGTLDARFGDVDSGDTRSLSRVLIQRSGLTGVSIAIVGFEIDSERAFENQIDSFTEAYVDILKRVWDEIKEELGAAAAFIIEKYGVKGLIGVAIAAVVALAVIAVAALWAPADLIIEDHIGLSTVDLATLTNANFPIPPEEELTSTGGIDVKIVPVSKGVQYRERREYRSDEEDSEYHITFRYNRLS